MNATASVKTNDRELHLSLKERVEVIRSNRYFLMIFPFAMLALMIVIFGVATQGRFFKPSVLKGILSQAMPSTAPMEMSRLPLE